MQTKDNLEAWRVFVSVARTGSIKPEFPVEC